MREERNSGGCGRDEEGEGRDYVDAKEDRHYQIIEIQQAGIRVERFGLKGLGYKLPTRVLSGLLLTMHARAIAA